MNRFLTAVLCPFLLSAADSDIRALLVNRVDQAHKAVGIVVGTLSPEGRGIIAYGKAAKNSDAALDGDTLFEIGSITKVFTSLILADMVERGEVTLDTPVQSLLPGTVKVPSRNGKQITLRDLSMQVSGLPRMPNNFQPADAGNPYADYGPDRLYAFLSGYSLSRDVGEKYEYSNVAVGLLGHALALKSGMSYEQLLRKRIFEPLGMNNTTITLSADNKKHLALGHDAALLPVKNWDLDALAGAGAIRSTANDMLKFLAANLELTESPLRPAMRRMRSMRHPTGNAGMDIMMAWHTLGSGDTEIVWHNGGTGGYRSFAGFVVAKKSAVVVLCNTSYDIDDIGRHILNDKLPAGMLGTAKVRTEVSLGAETLAAYPGDYALAPTFVIKISVEGEHLYAQATNQPRFELFAEKKDGFFLKVVDAQVTFVRGDKGEVTSLILHQNGMNQTGQKRPN